MLALLKDRVTGRIVVNAVLLDSMNKAVTRMNDLSALKEVAPGISSMQCAFSRLRLPLTRAVVVDAHGKYEDVAMSEMLDEVERGRIPFMLTTPNFDIKALTKMMIGRDIGCTIILCEELGHPTETISFGNAEHPPIASSRLLSLILADAR